MGDKKRIVLADAAEEFRQMLADMIGGEADLTVCAQTASGEELLDLIARHRPDVVVMDLMLSGMDGLEVLEEICPLSARMIVNQVSMQMETERIKTLISQLKELL